MVIEHKGDCKGGIPRLCQEVFARSLLCCIVTGGPPWFILWEYCFNTVEKL